MFVISVTLPEDVSTTLLAATAFVIKRLCVLCEVRTEAEEKVKDPKHSNPAPSIYHSYQNIEKNVVLVRC